MHGAYSLLILLEIQELLFTMGENQMCCIFAPPPSLDHYMFLQPLTIPWKCRYAGGTWHIWTWWGTCTLMTKNMVCPYSVSLKYVIWQFWSILYKFSPWISIPIFIVLRSLWPHLFLQNLYNRVDWVLCVLSDLIFFYKTFIIEWIGSFVYLHVGYTENYMSDLLEIVTDFNILGASVIWPNLDAPSFL